jgi:hypothetical protein
MSEMKSKEKQEGQGEEKEEKKKITNSLHLSFLALFCVSLRPLLTFGEPWRWCCLSWNQW